MKKKLALFIVCIMMLCMVISLPACATETTVSAMESTEIQLRDVNVNEDFNIKIGSSLMKVFNTGVIFGEDCDGFRTSITNVSGKYKYLVYSNGECIYESAEYSSGMTFTTRNVDPDVYHTVYIVNTGSTPLTGHVSISGIYS